MHQPQLFGDAQRATRWHLARRTAHVVARRDGSGYVIRVRWSQKLGLQLDHLFFSKAEADAVCNRVHTVGYITLSCWKKIYNPKWSAQCRTLSN